MKTNILAGLEGNERTETEANFKASALIRERLRYLLTQKIESRRSEMRSALSYEDASWSYKAADAVGYEKALFEVISLIS